MTANFNIGLSVSSLSVTSEVLNRFFFQNFLTNIFVYLPSATVTILTNALIDDLTRYMSTSSDKIECA